MILRRYGQRMQSVQPDFDARALNEVGFRRDFAVTIPLEEFEGGYERLDLRELTARAEGPVQDEAEVAMLADLGRQLDELVAALGEDQVLVVESLADDYPKTRDRKSTRSDAAGSRPYFEWWIDPPLRMGLYRKGG